MASRKNFPERKLKRKLEAEARQKLFDALPLEERVKRKRGWTKQTLAEIGEKVQ